MAFNPSIWYPIAVVLTVINLAGVPLAGTPVHATTHAVLAVAFGLWAFRLRSAPRGGDRPATDLQATVAALDVELSALRRELTETQERLDFAERLLAQQREPRRVDPQR